MPKTTTGPRRAVTRRSGRSAARAGARRPPGAPARRACPARDRRRRRSTTMRSARRTVDRRCAMISVVRPCIRRASAPGPALALGVERARGLVEDQDRGRPGRPARSRSAAAPRRRASAALAERGVVALRQPGDELVRIGGVRRRARPPRRSRPAPVARCSRGRWLRRRRVLQHQGDRLAERREGQRAQVEAVEQLRPVCGS